METALVFQGGGSLGAYEVGAVRRLSEEPWFPPTVVTGVSIGAINAALLAGGRYGPVKTLEEAWRRFAVDIPSGLPRPIQEAAALCGNPNFYLPRLDVGASIFWTCLYDVSPLRRTLEELIDFKKLNSPEAPKLVLTAVDVEAGTIEAFSNRTSKCPVTVDHILASGALPPSFPMVNIDGRKYWDGGIFSSTPLAEAIQGCQSTGQKLLIVVNLFRSAGRVPTNWQEAGSRFVEIMFSNKINADVKVTRVYNEFVATMDKIERLCPNIHQDLNDDPGWKRLRRYNDILAITIQPTLEAGDVMQGGHNFSRRTVEKRIELGYRDADRILAQEERYRKTLSAAGIAP